ncbi:MAG: TonB-dependent receptor [Acidobacteria bacterium]|nr:TonB-dependent receptor [Acidobacteriota bacterium]MBS1865157.1 TonB-dependent receptor [Acidobacteriota bacterium]
MSPTFRRILSFVLIVFAPTIAAAQANYTAQLTGVVTDSSGGIVPGASVSITDDATNIPVTTTTDDRGSYVFTGLRPGTYTLRVKANNFASVERKGLVLAVSQRATLDVTVTLGSVSTSVTVTTQAPLLDTADASLGTDVTNEYVRDIPLPNRSFFGLVFLAGGVTETAGQGTDDSYPTGTNFVSNGQRNATAEIRVDGALTSAPEQGEGATTNVYYQPSVEIVQEFKVENNSFSSEFGSNGGTVVNIVLKEGGNKFHGSGWWFGQRSALDANSFFNNAQGIEKPDHARDQYGFSLGGPIKKEKTFFFVDFEKLRQNDPLHIDAFVPTDDERKGDFRNSLLPIFNPFSVFTNGAGQTQRNDFAIPNLIDTGLIDPIGHAIINLYPEPTDPNAAPGDPNFHAATLSKLTARQYDVKIDHHFNDKNHLSARYSNHHDEGGIPTIFGDGDFGDGFAFSTDVHNASLEDNWNVTSSTVWTNRFAIDRAVAPVTENYPTLQSVGLPAILGSANGTDRMPVIQMDNNATSLFNQCCTDTQFAHTLYSYSSSLSWVKGRHVFKFGGEQRLFFNNFHQPNPPTGFFHFAQSVTEQIVGGGNSDQGSSFASLLLGYGDTDSFYAINPSVANKSKETAFYFQDDWKITSKLTLNLGLRYEWSTPYTERHNAIQFSDFSGDSGIAVPFSVPGILSSSGNLLGTTVFAGSKMRNAPVDRNNWAPRVGFAYALNPNTVIRGGAGVYYGLNVATNFQFPGTAFGNSSPIRFTKDNFQTQFATLENPFPDGLAQPQGRANGALALWGLPNNNSLDTGEARNAEIYQWNLGVQRLFPAQIVIGVDYSASRSTHLPFSSFSGTANRNFLPSSIRQQIVNGNETDCANQGLGASDCLNMQVTNPFQSLFAGPNAIFNEPTSIYNDDTIPLINLLRPFPQFDGAFSGLTRLSAESSYNSLQVRFQKRPSHYVSFEGNYTFAKSTDNSSAGANSFITGLLSSGNPQELDNLKAEHSISANDATHRFVIATIVDAPIGRGRWIGRDMNRVLDAFVGGWSFSTILTFQSGTPLTIGIADARLADGTQRPNVICPRLSTGISYHQAAATGAPILNENCFEDPGDQVAGNAPRYFSNLRSDGVHNADLSFSKEFVIREGMKLQVRGEFFNFTNTPRFASPDTLLGDAQFGQVTSTLGSPRRTQIGVRFEF